MGRFSGVFKSLSIVSGLKSIGSLISKAFKGLSGKLVLKWGGIGAGISGIFYGVYAGLKGAVSSVSEGGTSFVKSVVKTLTGHELSDSSAMMIFAAIVCVFIIGVVVWFRRRKSRR